MGKYLSKPSAARELQLALIAAGYSVGPSGADGILGEDTAKAVRAYRKAHGLSEAAVIDNQMLRLLGLGPALITEPGTLGNIIALPIIDLVLQRLTKGAITVSFLTGYKTFIIGGVLIVLGALELLGWQVPGVPLDPSQGIPTIMTGIGLITGRVGAKTEAAKATGQQ